MNVCLHQIRTIEYRRLSSRLGTIDESDFERVVESFHALYTLKKIFPLKRGPRQIAECKSIVPSRKRLSTKNMLRPDGRGRG